MITGRPAMEAIVRSQATATAPLPVTANAHRLGVTIVHPAAATVRHRAVGTVHRTVAADLPAVATIVHPKEGNKAVTVRNARKPNPRVNKSPTNAATFAAFFIHPFHPPQGHQPRPVSA